jgi:hypothetical protein
MHNRRKFKKNLPAVMAFLQFQCSAFHMLEIAAAIKFQLLVIDLRSGSCIKAVDGAPLPV